MTKRVVLLLSLLVLTLLLGPLAAHAQDGPEPEVVPLSTVPESQPNGLRLQTYFLVRDKKTGRRISPNEIESTALKLGNGAEPVPALLENPTTPIKIALLLDESGSMANYVPAVRAAAKDAITKAPDQAQFAIFRFSEVPSEGQIEPDLGFTPKSDSQTINTFIDQQYNSQPGAPTCLYNITLQATRYLAANTQPGERRAIILFTDGTDERASGGPCSDRTIDDATREAGPESKTATPVYMVGLCPAQGCKVDTSVLDRMATQTKGIWRSGKPEELVGMFYDVMDDLTAQRLAEAIIKPCKEKQVTLLVKLVNTDQPLEGVVPFANERCYSPQASAKIGERQSNESQETFDFPVTIQNPSPLELASLSVQVTFGSDTVYTQTLDGPEYSLPAGGERKVTIAVPSRYMLALGEYNIRVTGATSDGVSFVNTADGKQTEVLGEIPYKQTVAADIQIRIKSVRPNDAMTSLAVTVDIANKNIIDPANLRFVQYEGKIFADNGNEVQSIEPTGIDLTDIGSSFSVDIKLDEKVRSIQQPTPYKLSLTLLTPRDARRGTPPQSYESTNQQPFTLTPLPPPSFGEQFLSLVSNPLVLGVLLALILGAVGFSIYRRYQARRVIPSPFNSPTMLRVPGGTVSSGGTGDKPNDKPRPNPPPPAPPRTPQSKPPVSSQLDVTKAAPVVPDNGATQLQAPPASNATVLHNETEIADMPPKQPQVRISVVQTVDRNQVREATLTLPCVIGRENVHVIISGDPKISRTHAEIAIDNGQFVVIDRGSANGTFIGDTRLTKGEPVPISGPTQVRLGPNTMVEVEPKY